MKRLLTFLLLLGSAWSVKATHLMGGDLIATSDSNGVYHITLTYYRDTIGIPLYQSEMIHVYTYDAVTNTYTADTTLLAPLDTALSLSLLPSFPYGVEVGVYTTSFTPGVGQYRFVVETCCRNGAIKNASNPLSESMTLYTDLLVDSLHNSTPACLALPVAYFPVNQAAVYNPLPYDPDADSISWNLNTPISTHTFGATGFNLVNVVGFTAPSATASGPFTMNAVTGEINWTPDTVGNFIQSFVINEYKAGVHVGSIVRDMQYVVVPGGTNSSPFFVPVSTFNTNSSQNYNYIYYTPGQPLYFQIKGNDIDQNPLQLQAFSELLNGANHPATFNSGIVGNEVIGTFSWTPTSAFTKDILVVFRLRDGYATKDFTLVLKRSGSLGVHNVNNNITSLKVYPNPAHNQLNIALQLEKEMANAQIDLYNTLGQKVQNIYQGKMMKGSVSLQQNLNVASGMYFLTVKDNGAVIKTETITIQ